jgi:hypothetical protein
MPMFQRCSPPHLADFSDRRPIGMSAVMGFFCAAVLLAVATQPSSAALGPVGATGTALIAWPVGDTSLRGGIFCDRQRWAYSDRHCLKVGDEHSQGPVRLAENLATTPDLQGLASLDNESVVEMDGERTQVDIRGARISTRMRPPDTLAATDVVGRHPQRKIARINRDHVRVAQDPSGSGPSRANQSHVMRRWVETTYPGATGDGSYGKGRAVAMRKGKVMSRRYDPNAYAYSPRH